MDDVTAIFSTISSSFFRSAWLRQIAAPLTPAMTEKGNNQKRYFRAARLSVLARL
jgi:hypothetical protein